MIVKKKKNKISEQAARLKKIRLYLGMKREEFSKILSVSPYTIRSWEIGAKPFPEMSMRRTVEALKEKTQFFCSFDWLAHGLGTSPISLYEEKNNLEVDSVHVDPLQESLLEEAVFFKRFNKHANVIIVSDETFEPFASVGDYLGLLAIDVSRLGGYRNQLLFFLRHDETKIFGILRKQGHRFFLETLEKKAELLSLEKVTNAFQIIWFRKAITD